MDESMNGEIAITVIATGFPVISAVKLLNGTWPIAWKDSSGLCYSNFPSDTSCNLFFQLYRTYCNCIFLRM